MDADGFAQVLADYDYELPASAVAQTPAEPRDHARLMVLAAAPARSVHARFHELGRFLEPGDLLVLNDTRVLPARLLGRRLPGGGSAEILLVRERGPGRWDALLRLPGRARPDVRVELDAGYTARLVAPGPETLWEVAIDGPGTVARLLEIAGHVPLPPYIRRPDVPADRERYQTVYARRPGAVAAPTAGLHFTPRLLAELAARGILRAALTLHVGPGTFRPVGHAELHSGELHGESYELPPAAAARINAARARGARVVAVGTTCARVLETCAAEGRRVRPGSGDTHLFLRPPRKPQVVDALITNFHLPRTSLLMLVAAFAGRERILDAYREALAAGYRFYSYGDAMLIL